MIQQSPPYPPPYLVDLEILSEYVLTDTVVEYVIPSGCVALRLAPKLIVVEKEENVRFLCDET